LISTRVALKGLTDHQEGVGRY